MIYKYILAFTILAIGILIGMIIELAAENIQVYRDIKDLEKKEEESEAEITTLQPNEDGDYFRPF